MGSLPAIAGLGVLCLVFSVLDPAFATPRNFANLFGQGAQITVIAMGLVFVLLLGEIDLSAGYTSGVCAAVLAVLLADYGWPWYLAVLAALVTGTVIAIDGKETWLIHNHLYDGEPDFDSIDRDWALRTILGVPDDFTYEVLSKEDWTGRRLVADRFRDRRAFIAGDAAHLWIPYAGYGMNAGIADAMDMSWMLAAVLNGWAPASLLDAYERERQPITEQVSKFAMEMALNNMRQRKATPPEVELPGPEGDAVRARVGKEAYDLNVNQYCCGGLNFGYTYYQVLNAN